LREKNIFDDQPGRSKSSSAKEGIGKLIEHPLAGCEDEKRAEKRKNYLHHTWLDAKRQNRFDEITSFRE